MMRALREKDPAGFKGTIEFFPEEGKYHLDGHRACNQCLTPEQTRAAEGRCPECGAKVTVGCHASREQTCRPQCGQPARERF